MLLARRSVRLSGMKLDSIFSDYFTVRNELVQAVMGLTAEQLAFNAPGHPASIGSLLAHIAETEHWWIRQVALGGEDSTEGASGETDLTLGDLLTRLNDCFEMTGEFLHEQSTDEWDILFFAVPGRDEKVSLRWLVWHVVEHQARHRGQIFMLLHMQKIEVPNV